MNQDINTQVENIARSVFQDDSIQLNEQTTAHDIERWDSLSNMIFLHEIETAFKIKFAFREVRALKNVGELNALILKKTQN